MEKGLAGLGDRRGLDQLVAKDGEGADAVEALACPVGSGPCFELVECDLEVFADVEDGEGALEEGAEQQRALAVGERGFVGAGRVGDSALHGTGLLPADIVHRRRGEARGEAVRCAT